MLRKKRFWIIVIVATVLALAAVLLLGKIQGGPDIPVARLGYEDRIFATDRIHSIDIRLENWEGFLETCPEEKYTRCTVVINNEQFDNVGIRAKGNSSLTTVTQLGSSRYSLKLEFDHYDDSQSYHGLDKLNLNNLIQDNTMMKDFLVYRMMQKVGTAAPLCSYAQVRVNGNPLGLYLAVEGIEESFLQRSFGSDYGQLYKPDADNGQDRQPQEHQPPRLQGEALRQALDEIGSPKAFPSGEGGRAKRGRMRCSTMS